MGVLMLITLEHGMCLCICYKLYMYTYYNAALTPSTALQGARATREREQARRGKAETTTTARVSKNVYLEDNKLHLYCLSLLLGAHRHTNCLPRLCVHKHRPKMAHTCTCVCDIYICCVYINTLGPSRFKLIQINYFTAREIICSWRNALSVCCAGEKRI